MADITNSTTTSALPPDVENASRAVLQDALKQFGQGYMPASTVNERFAPMPEAHKAANKLAGETGAYERDFARARTRAGDANKPYPEAYQQYMNPGLPGIQQILNRQFEENFKRDQANLDAQFASRGLHGGPLYNQRVRELQNAHTQKVTDAHQKLLMDMYKEGAQTFGAEQDQALEVAKFLATLGQANQAGQMQDIVSQLQTGDVLANEDEKRRAFEHARREDEIRHPSEKINSLLSALQGRPYSTTTRYTASQNHVQPSMRSGNYAAAMLPHIAGFVAAQLANAGRKAHSMGQAAQAKEEAHRNHILAQIPIWDQRVNDAGGWNKMFTMIDRAKAFHALGI